MPAPLTDVRIVALARAACAAQRPLRLILLRGYWRAADIRRIAGAAVSRGIETGEIAPAAATMTLALFQRRLAALLAAAPMVGDGLNSLAEHLGGRAAERADRLQLIPPQGEDPPPNG
jgi:hypothetical protein